MLAYPFAAACCSCLPQLEQIGAPQLVYAKLNQAYDEIQPGFSLSSDLSHTMRDQRTPLRRHGWPVIPEGEN